MDDNLSLMSAGFLLPSLDAAVIWRGPKKNGLIKQLLRDVDWTPSGKVLSLLTKFNQMSLLHYSLTRNKSKAKLAHLITTTKIGSFKCTTMRKMHA